MKRYSVTLIHGTWAPKAPWVEAGSPLRRALKEKLDGNVVFNVVRWSGRNRFKDRYDAAQIVAKVVEESVGEEPDAAQFLIAHSHGGNVALCALNHESLQTRVTGVVCLSTPFLLVKTRRFEGEHNRLFFAAQFAPVVAAWVWCLWHYGLTEATEGLMFLCFIVVWPVMKLLFEWLIRKAKLLAEQMRFPPLRENQLLIIRHSGDEAGAGLNACQLAGSVIEPVLGGLNKRWQGWEERRKNRLVWPELIVAAVVGWAVAAWIILRQADPAMSGWGVAILALVAGGLLGPMCYAVLLVGGMVRLLLLGSTFLLLTPVVGILTLFFGPEAFAIGLLMQVTAEATPPGRWLVQLFTQISGNVESTPLTHSVAYDDPAVHEAIASWMKQAA